MPVLRVSVDGNTVAAIPTEGREIVGAQVGGTHDDPDYADLSAWGGTYARGDGVDHRIWLDHLPLKPGQSIEVELLATGTEIGTGIPVGRQGPDSPPPGYLFEEDLRTLAAELRDLPRVRERYRVRYSSAKTPRTDFETEPSEYGFGLNVLWNDLYPSRLSVSLYAYSLESMEKQEDGRDGVREKLSIGEKCELAFVA